ncbi:phosphogluconate dehydrogenase, NAD-binding, putative-like protein [Kribbella flavida DSM 17836]|uniref:Phosphogluconate dehydrogenase, NAD-binding, putative-like protein n=1 Tax=Kribbella flavida (strain DSM 17836 / JCM 10339 / NBRC 14399) TaxID=479435 RepID=D2PPB5_KRIFD|nr:NAD(P)-binding domain-containing protein [Kribbella flavida]ADB34711.1 phosphogluconate dehydrogenase, NAD-binding, putative-like protein [Kribbella flavida DSM 17836]
MRVAVFHPGAMGSQLAAQLVRAGHEVHWVPDGRSTASVERAEQAGLIGTSFAEAVGAAEVVLCSCAPQGALEVAEQVGRAGFAGVYVEANPLSPQSLTEAQSALPQATFVDAGVVGPPPTGGPAPTHLMLSGAAAQQVAELWSGTAVTPMVVGTEPGAASAAKSAYALYNKGKAALAVLAFELAAEHGVTEALTAQHIRADAGSLSDPKLPERLRSVAWRWGPEFDELAQTLDAAGLEGDAARALRQVWTKLT